MKDILDAPEALDAAPLAASEGTFDWAGATFRILQTAGTGDASILDCRTRPGFGPPRISLRDTAVTLVVTEGEIELWIEGRMRRVAAGQSATVPAGASHAYQSAVSGPSRHLHIVATPGFEAFLREVAGPRMALPGSRRSMFESGLRHGIDFRGPPLGAY